MLNLSFYQSIYFIVSEYNKLKWEFLSALVERPLKNIKDVIRCYLLNKFMKRTTSKVTM